MTVYFSPAQDIRSVLVHAVSGAKTEVRLCGYVFDLPDLTAALVERHSAGVDVALLLNRPRAGQSYPAQDAAYAALAAAGVPVLLGVSQHGRIIHDKYMVIDQSTVITGSYNFTRAAQAESNAIEVIVSKGHAALYLREWQALYDYNAARPHLAAAEPPPLC